MDSKKDLEEFGLRERPEEGLQREEYGIVGVDAVLTEEEWRHLNNSRVYDPNTKLRVNAARRSGVKVSVKNVSDKEIQLPNFYGHTLKPDETVPVLIATGFDSVPSDWPMICKPYKIDELMAAIEDAIRKAA